jgi:DUF1680 family protein
VDNPGIDLRAAAVLPEWPIQEDFRPDLLGGVTALQVEASMNAIEVAESGRLYRTRRSDNKMNNPAKAEASLRMTAIPYYAWANREPGQMQVWMAQASPG